MMDEFRTWSLPFKCGKLKTTLRSNENYTDAYITYVNDNGEEQDLCCIATNSTEENQDKLFLVVWPDDSTEDNTLLEQWEIVDGKAYFKDE